MSAQPPSSGDSAPAVGLLLYIAGDGPNSVAAIANLQNVIAQFPHRRIELEIIDVIAEPALGLRAGVLVTPMLLKLAPAPQRRLLGNLKDQAALVAALGLELARE